MFTAIKINDTNYKFKTGSVETEINGLNKINIFVGQNNSGKSRFMRSIVLNKIEFKTEDFLKTRDFLNAIGDEIIQWCTNMRFGNTFPYGIEFKQIIIGDYFIEGQKLYDSIESILNRIESGKNKHDSSIGNLTFAQVNKNIDDKYKNKVLEFNFEIEKVKFGNYKKVYIPMLRGLKNPIKDSKDDLYNSRTYQDYFSGISHSAFEIFTGLSLYEDIKKMLLGNHEEREKVKAFEEFLSVNFFRKEPITLIPRDGDDVLYVDIGKVKNKAIYDLGDGIQSIIINTFPLFKYKDENLLLFIEEPEMGIHPGMQRILLNTFSKGIQSEGKEHQIYFTTHSNHFLDIALEKEINEKISVYQFKETDNIEEKHITNISKNKEVLDLLGVRNSSVFLSNCVIWVEGVSDRIYIKKFLELYQSQLPDKNKIFEEDKHFSIIEYGGGNITHFNFGEEESEEQITIEALTSNNFLVGDNDGENSDDAKKERIKEFKKEKKDLCWFDIPEIENLLNFETYKKYFDDLQDHGKRNWKKKASFDENAFNKDINTKDIGEIMRNIFIEFKDKRGKKYKDFQKVNDIKIIADKRIFAQKITEKYLTDYSKLSKKAKELTQTLHTFIASNNS